MENEKSSEEGRTPEREREWKAKQSDRKTKLAKDKANKNNEKKQTREKEELLHPAMDDPSCKRY